MSDFVRTFLDIIPDIDQLSHAYVLDSPVYRVETRRRLDMHLRTLGRLHDKARKKGVPMPPAGVACSPPPGSNSWEDWRWDFERALDDLVTACRAMAEQAFAHAPDALDAGADEAKTAAFAEAQRRALEAVDDYRAPLEDARDRLWRCGEDMKMYFPQAGAGTSDDAPPSPSGSAGTAAASIAVPAPTLADAISEFREYLRQTRAGDWLAGAAGARRGPAYWQAQEKQLREEWRERLPADCPPPPPHRPPAWDEAEYQAAIDAMIWHLNALQPAPPPVAAAPGGEGRPRLAPLVAQIIQESTQGFQPALALLPNDVRRDAPPAERIAELIHLLHARASAVRPAMMRAGFTAVETADLTRQLINAAGRLLLEGPARAARALTEDFAEYETGAISLANRIDDVLNTTEVLGGEPPVAAATPGSPAQQAMPAVDPPATAARPAPTREPAAPAMQEDAKAAVPTVVKDAEAGDEAPWPVLMAASDLALRLGMTIDAVNSFLNRHRKKYDDCYEQVEAPRRNEPRIMYRTEDVVPFLKRKRDKRK